MTAITDRPSSFQQPSLGSLCRRPVLSLRQMGLVLDAQGVVPGGPRRLSLLRPQRLGHGSPLNG